MEYGAHLPVIDFEGRGWPPGSLASYARTARQLGYTSITTYPAAALGCKADEVGILTGEVTAQNSALWSTRVGIVKHC